MFEGLDVLAARLLATAPTQDDPCAPVLDRDGTLIDRLVGLARLIAAAQAETMLIHAAITDWATTWQDTHDPRWETQLGPAGLAAAEIAPALHLSPRTAACHVTRAVEIVTRLPLTLAALRRGDLDLGRVLAILDATTVLSDTDAGNVEALVLPRAVDQTAAELRAALGKAVIAVDPDAAEKRRKAAVNGRRVTRYQRGDGTSTIEAILSAFDTGEIYDLIDEIARHTKTENDTRSMDARRADALVFALLGRDPHLGPEDDDPPAAPADDQPIPDEPEDDGSANSTDPADEPEPDPDDPGPVEPDDLDQRYPPERITELATLALSAMTTRRPPSLPWVAINHTTRPDGTVVLVGELQAYGPITHQYAHHLLATGAARPPPAPSDREPTPEQARRHDPPDWLATEIRTRDGTCRYPGCRQPAHRTDLDHTVPFPRGLTVRTNLGGLCRRHHQVKGTGSWTVTQHNEGAYTWTSKLTGHTYTTHPRGTTGDWRGASHHPSG